SVDALREHAGKVSTLTKNVANAFAANRIRCNGILTGWMDTPGESATQQKFHGVGDKMCGPCHGHKRMGVAGDPRFLFEREFYRIFGGLEVRPGSRYRGNVNAGTGVDKELNNPKRVLLSLLGLLVEMG